MTDFADSVSGSVQNIRHTEIVGLTGDSSKKDIHDLRNVQNRSAARSVSGYGGMSNLKSLLQKRDCNIVNRKQMFHDK